jgi:hypothetical protein
MQAGEACRGCKTTGMLRIIACAAAALFGTFLVGAGPTSAPDALTARVQSAYDAQCNDLLHDDFTSLENTFSPSFSASQNGSTVTRDDVVMAMKAFVARGAITKCATSVQSAQEESNVVIAVVTQQIGGTWPGPKGKPVPIEIDASHRDLWTDDPSGLKETTSSSIWSRFYVNGQLQQNPAAPQATP